MPGTSPAHRHPDLDARPLHVLGPPRLSLAQLRRSLAALPRYGDLLVVLTLHRFKVRYRQSVLGLAWAVLQPLAMMVTFTLVFSLLAPMPSGGYPYPLFAYAGLLPWAAFASAIGSAPGSLVSHAALVTRIYFPREILTLTYVAAAIADLVIASSILGVMLVYYDVPLTWALAWVPPLLLLLAAFALAMSLALAAINVRYRDVTIAVPLLLQIGMFASPVLYPLEAAPAWLRPWYLLNPMAAVVDGFRRAVLGGGPPDWALTAAAAGVTAVALPAAYVLFKQVDATLADEI